MKEFPHKISLDRPSTYQIKVPGHLEDSWSEWTDRMTIELVSMGDGEPATILTGAIDQAALHGLLRSLYSLGLPLISVICLECS